jgi:cation diffusion facilitator family transporter
MRDTDHVIRRGERAALVSSLVTALLAIGKGLAGFFTGSLVLITDAIHSATDLLPIMVSWLGLRISRRKPDRRFPYGYYKAESIATLFISLFIIYAAIQFIIEGYHRLFEISSISLPLVAGSAALLSAVASAFLARYQKRVGEETGSQSLIVNSRDTAIDVIASLMVLVAIVLSYYRIPYIEGVAILLLSILILRMGIVSLRDAVFGLMDISPSREVEREIIRTIGTIAGVEGFQDLRLRKSGPLIFGEVTVKIRRHVDVDRAHEVSSVLESEVQNRIERLGSFTVHIEPYEVPESRVVVPLANSEGMGSSPSNRFGRAAYFAVVTLDKERKEVEEWEVQENSAREKEVRAGLSAVRSLVDEKIDSLITQEIGEISFHALRDNLVSIYRLRGDSLQEVIDHYLNGDLEMIHEPLRIE